MNVFTISQLQQYSGIKVHSIRAWEKRYDALVPKRSEGNTRYYDGNQLRRLLNIAGLMNGEYKISELCAMSDASLFELIEKQNLNSTERNEFLVSQIVAAALDFNEYQFNKVLEKAIVDFTMEGAYMYVIYPSLQRLGLMWSANGITLAQEHFISHLIRQKLNRAIDELPVNENSKNHWLLFLNENEFHETSLLMANYMIRKAGFRCTYLGGNMPFDALIQAVKQLKPSHLLYFLVSRNDENADKEYIRKLKSNFPTQRIVAAGEPLRFQSIKPSKNFTINTSMEQLSTLLK